MSRWGWSLWGYTRYKDEGGRMKDEITVVKLGGTDGVDFSAICADAVELLNQIGRAHV